MDEDGLENLAVGDEKRFVEARDGDFLMTPFQCELCHFRNMMERDPDYREIKDKRLLRDVRQANLDAFWSREPSTVAANLSQAKRMEEIGDWYGFGSVSPALGPFPLEDTFGMKAAVCLNRRSLDRGRTEKHVQFSTARKLRSAFSNAYHASQKLAGVSAMAFQSTKTYSTTCPTFGYWFDRFILGCHKRMGDVTVSDFALSKPIYLELVNQLESDWDDALDVDTKYEVALFATLLNALYLTGLRGEEGMKLDLAGFLKYLDVGATDPKHPHVILPILGRLKGETGERYHMIPMARVTKSGIMAGRWADRLGLLMVKKGRRNGWIFRDKKGAQAKIGSYNEEFINRLSRVRILKPHLFEPNLNLADAYGLRRSPRRGSTSEATNGGVRREIIELNNRWRKFDESKGRRPSMSMASHYTEIRLMLPTLWQYSVSF